MLQIGADEVGTGSLIFSFYVAGVLAEDTWSIQNLNDSKKLTKLKRERIFEDLYKEKQKGNIDFYLAHRTNEQIDEFGLSKCLYDSYIEIHNHFNNIYMIVDGNLAFPSSNNLITSIIKADSTIPTVMAASILAKVTRDKLVENLHLKYPDYDWINNMGYGTKKHIEAIKKFGMTEYHRKSYKIQL